MRASGGRSLVWGRHRGQGASRFLPPSHRAPPLCYTVTVPAYQAGHSALRHPQLARVPIPPLSHAPPHGVPPRATPRGRARLSPYQAPRTAQARLQRHSGHVARSTVRLPLPSCKGPRARTLTHAVTPPVPPASPRRPRVPAPRGLSACRALRLSLSPRSARPSVCRPRRAGPRQLVVRPFPLSCASWTSSANALDTRLSDHVRTPASS